MDAREKLVALRKDWTDCKACGLSQIRSGPRIVFGGGVYNADYLIVTDAPTEHDLAKGVPLCGQDGSMLGELLVAAGIEPSDTFRASMVACRPFLTIPATDTAPARIEDRPPTKDELVSCLPRLERLIYYVDPRIILAMGDAAWRVLVKSKKRDAIDRVKANTHAEAVGSLYDTWVKFNIREVRYPVMALLSPKQIMSNPSTAVHGPMATTLESLRRAHQYVNALKDEEAQ